MSLETGTNVWHASVEIPDDTDERDAAGTNIALEGLLDRTTYLYEHTAVAGVSLVTPITVTRAVPMSPLYDVAKWAPVGDTLTDPILRYVLQAGGTASEAKDWVLLDLSGVLPNTATILGFSVKYCCSDASALPTNVTNRVRAGVFRQDMASTDAINQLTQVGSLVSDASANLTAYQQVNYLTSVVMSSATIAGNTYYIGFRSDENGKGILYQATITYSSAIILPGGA